MLKRLHQNLGHPSNEDLARTLRLRGAKKHVQVACRALRCATCARHVRPKPPRPGRLGHVGDFNEMVYIDCLEIADAHGTKHMGLSIVDDATTFHVVALLQNVSAVHLAEVFEESWLRWAGAGCELGECTGRVQANAPRLVPLPAL